MSFDEAIDLFEDHFFDFIYVFFTTLIWSKPPLPPSLWLSDLDFQGEGRGFLLGNVRYL